MFLNLFWCNSQAKNYINLSRGGGGGEGKDGSVYFWGLGKEQREEF